MAPFHNRALVVLVVAALAAGCRPPDAGRADTAASDYLRIVAAEDARPTGGADLQVLLDAEHDAHALLRAAAVRGLGRLENPAMLEHIAPLLADPDTAVRARAADAMAQAVFRGSGEAAAPALLDRVRAERSPWVRGVLARSLGRLRLDEETRERQEARARVARALVVLSHDGAGGDASPAQLLGVALGMEAFAQGARGRPLGDTLVARIQALALEDGGASHGPGAGAARDTTDAMTATRSAHIRELAIMALGYARALDSTVVEVAMHDPDVEVRVATVSGVLFPRGPRGPAPGRSLSTEARGRVALRALGDPSPQVRVLGVRALARSVPDSAACARLLMTAADDPDTGVRLAALDGLGHSCPDRAPQVTLLVATARSLADGDLTWHAPAHALVALAHVDPARARELLPDFARHADPFVRMYAAQAAGAVGDTPLVASLSDDPVPNVRTAAVQQLSALEGRGADTVLIRALAEAQDPQLLFTVVHLLGKSVEDGDAPFRRHVADVALETLDRVSRSRQETLRDARLSLLGLVARAGAPEVSRGEAAWAPDSTFVERLARYLVDYDPAVADSAAAVLRGWTGTDYDAEPQPLPRLPLPSPEALRAMEHATVVLHMVRGGSIEIRLLPLVAPTNAFRLYEQARRGVLDGRTFHRVIPDFVIQGGSPDANEYSGNGAFTRDELGLPVQWRGTVGLSTRGRDTGDGQLYINLVDNVRLDHDYTVFGVVTAGMDVADAVLEGDVIRRAEVRPGR